MKDIIYKENIILNSNLFLVLFFFNSIGHTDTSMRNFEYKKTEAEDP